MHVNYLDTSHGVWSSLADGGSALLQPLERGAEAPVLAVFDGLSPRSRELRFLTGVPRLTKHMLAALTDVDDCRHAAWIALVDGRPSGIARYVRVSADTAELAFEVVDAQHRRGLGLLLLDTVATLAQANGSAASLPLFIPTTVRRSSSYAATAWPCTSTTACSRVRRP